jgi:hypothetical protein
MANSMNILHELKIGDLFKRPVFMNIVEVEQILIEVYWESRMEPEWEVPGVFIGVRFYEDGILKEDLLLHEFGNYGLFSYTAVHRHKSTMEFAVHIADFIANKMLNGFEAYDFKIKKRFVSQKHIYLLNIPADYEIVMPGPTEEMIMSLEIEILEHELRRKKLMNPTDDYTREQELIDKKAREIFELLTSLHKNEDK